MFLVLRSDKDKYTGAGGNPAGKTTMNLGKSDRNQMGFLLSYSEAG